MSVAIKRKCSCCGNDLYIDVNNINEAIYYDKKTYHSSCFIEMCNKRINMKRKNVSQKWQEVLDNIEEIKQHSYEHFNTFIIKDELFRFIIEAYHINIIPTTVWQKINNIYNGTFKGMSIGIPPSHLLDMWQKKIHLLNKIANDNKTKGLEMSIEKRLNYDLSILVNKYDSYLKWIEKQKILEIESKQSIDTNSQNVNIYIMNIQSNENNTKESTDNMIDLVDDIFDN